MLEIPKVYKSILPELGELLRYHSKQHLLLYGALSPIKDIITESICYKSLKMFTNYKIEFNPGSHKSGSDIDLLINNTKIPHHIKSCDRKKYQRTPKKPPVVEVAFSRSTSKNELENAFEQRVNHFNKINSDGTFIFLCERTKGEVRKVTYLFGYRFLLLTNSILMIDKKDELVGKNVRINKYGVKWGVKGKLSQQLWCEIPVDYVDDPTTSLTLADIKLNSPVPKLCDSVDVDEQQFSKFPLKAG